MPQSRGYGGIASAEVFFGLNLRVYTYIIPVKRFPVAIATGFLVLLAELARCRLEKKLNMRAHKKRGSGTVTEASFILK